MIFYFKHKNNMLPSSLSTLITNYTPNNRYHLRQTNAKLLNEIFCFNKNTENCLRFSIPKLINNSPLNIRNILDLRNITTVKMKLKTEMINEYPNNECREKNCYPCNQKLFYPKYLSKSMQFINIFSYAKRSLFHSNL